MSIWVVRAGSKGQFEDFALEEGVVAIDFDVRKDLTEFDDSDDIDKHMRNEQRYQDLSNQKVASARSQLWTFAKKSEKADMVILPRKISRLIAIGRISGDYNFRSDLAEGPGCHTREVEWEVTDIPRHVFDPDLLASLGGAKTIFQPRASDAERRVERVLSTHHSEEPVVDSETGVHLPEDDAP